MSTKRWRGRFPSSKATIIGIAIAEGAEDRREDSPRFTVLSAVSETMEGEWTGEFSLRLLG